MTTSNRRSARERALQGLYAFELGGGDREHVIETVIKPNLLDSETNLQFAIKLFNETIDRKERTIVLVDEHAKNWDYGRIAVVDRLVLQMAVTELLFFEDIPPKVTINEAIEISKRFSTYRSGQFVNGILDSILAQVRSAGDLKKSGRGLVGLDSLREVNLTPEAEAT